MTRSSVTGGSRRTIRTLPVLPPATLAGFVIAVLAVGAIAFFTSRALQTREDAAQRVTHTLQVIGQLESLLSRLTDAETGQRGFLLTGDERYLEPYAGGKVALSRRIQGVCATSMAAQPRAGNGASMRSSSWPATSSKRSDQTIALKRAGDTEGALAHRPHRSGQGGDGSHPRARAEIERQERAALDGAAGPMAGGDRAPRRRDRPGAARRCSGADRRRRDH